MNYFLSLTIRRMLLVSLFLSLFVLPMLALHPLPVSAAQPQQSGDYTIGLKTRVGGRYDNVRMCVATPAGVKGGSAADISFFLEYAFSPDSSIAFDLPVFRPLLFAAAFEMLQYEPSVSLLYRLAGDESIDYIVGPTFGASFHYGPDYRSEPSGDARRDSFFAMGPTAGAYLGLDFKRPGETFNFQLGISPYFTPLFGIDDPDHHQGVVIGALLDGVFRFSLGR